MCITYFYFTPYCDPSPPSWKMDANIMYYFWKFFHYQKDCIPGSVKILLST